MTVSELSEPPLTRTEVRLIAIMLVSGNVSRVEFNTLCNTDGIHNTARDTALERIRDNKELCQAIFNHRDGL